MYGARSVKILRRRCSSRGRSRVVPGSNNNLSFGALLSKASPSSIQSHLATLTTTLFCIKTRDSSTPTTKSLSPSRFYHVGRNTAFAVAFQQTIRTATSRLTTATIQSHRCKHQHHLSSTTRARVTRTRGVSTSNKARLAMSTSRNDDINGDSDASGDQSNAPFSSESAAVDAAVDADNVGDEAALVETASAANSAAAAGGGNGVHIHVDVVDDDDNGVRSKEKKNKSRQGGGGVIEGTATGATTDAEAKRRALRQVYTSVCKLFVWKTEPNFALPWQMRPQRQSSGSAFVISGRRLLTNAHVLANASQVLIRAHGDSKRYVARILAVAHDCDLAMLTVDDDDFWSGVRELSLSHVPHLQDSVVVVGYPTGGDNLSVTKGVVSRVDVHPYSHSGHRLLCVQIDAAINSGNSGGPALIGSEVVGVAFQARSAAENIGYVIPTLIVERFLQDVGRGQQADPNRESGESWYSGTATIGLLYQRMENKQLRRYTKLDSIGAEMLPEGVTASGVLVCESDPMRPPNDNVHPGDVVLALDDNDIADDGTVLFRDRERVNLLYAFTNKFVGDTARVTLLRDGNVIVKHLTLQKPVPLVPSYLYDIKPRYCIFGGLVFVPLSHNYLRNEYGQAYVEKASAKLLNACSRRFRDFEDEEIVVLAHTLACDITVGYEFRRQILESVNGCAVRNLKHLAQMLDECEEEFVTFSLKGGFSVIFEREAAEKSMQDLLEHHNIPQPRSAEL